MVVCCGVCATMTDVKIAIQGLDTSFHALAAHQLFGSSADLVCCKNFKEVFSKLENDQVEQAVVAIENSLYGSINEVYDLLLRYQFWISGEAYEHVGLQLLGITGTKLEEITDVYSQAPALAEAEAFLDLTLPHAERHEHQDTALAAQEVASWNDPRKAAIASEAAAKKYNLEIIAGNIETHQQNYTRFIALQRQEAINKSANKFSLTFRTSDTPGSLHAALGVFAEHQANLTKLESRPIIGAAWQYMYYIDCTCADINPILKKLTQYATNIRLLGAYQTGVFARI